MLGTDMRNSRRWLFLSHCQLKQAHWALRSGEPFFSVFRLFWCNIQNSWLQEKVRHLSCINKTPRGESCSMSVVVAAERNGICFLCSIHPNVVRSSCTHCSLFMYNIPEKSPHKFMVINLKKEMSRGLKWHSFNENEIHFRNLRLCHDNLAFLKKYIF